MYAEGGDFARSFRKKSRNCAEKFATNAHRTASVASLFCGSPLSGDERGVERGTKNSQEDTHKMAVAKKKAAPKKAAAKKAAPKKAAAKKPAAKKKAAKKK